MVHSREELQRGNEEGKSFDSDLDLSFSILLAAYRCSVSVKLSFVSLSSAATSGNGRRKETQNRHLREMQKRVTGSGISAREYSFMNREIIIFTPHALFFTLSCYELVSKVRVTGCNEIRNTYSLRCICSSGCAWRFNFISSIHWHRSDCTRSYRILRIAYH